MIGCRLYSGWGAFEAVSKAFTYAFDCVTGNSSGFSILLFSNDYYDLARTVHFLNGRVGSCWNCYREAIGKMSIVTKSIQAFVGVAALGLAGIATAEPVYFDLAGDDKSSVAVELTGKSCLLSSCGVEATLNQGLDGLKNSLSAGQSWSFNFFSLDFYGIGAGSGTIQASLGFDAPSDAPTATGSGGGSFLSAFFFSAGNLTWTKQPGVFTLANGSSYSVKFQDLYGVSLGDNVNVRALLTLNSEPTSVPEPGTLALLGLGLLGTGLARRKMARKAMS